LGTFIPQSLQILTARLGNFRDKKCSNFFIQCLNSFTLFLTENTTSPLQRLIAEFCEEKSSLRRLICRLMQKVTNLEYKQIALLVAINPVRKWQ
jgi:ubiquinone biosynthesis protein UbiJ